MHGSVHDFVVVSTVAGGGAYPTGHGSDARASEFVGEMKSWTQRPKYKKVLDIGALDICGNMRDYTFCGKGPKWIDLIGAEEYIGIDLMAGRNVDQIMNAHNLDFPDDTFDLVMCLSMLEHDANPGQTIREAYRVTKPGQPFIMTTVSAIHPEHKHLGGGDTETYNYFQVLEVEQYFKDAGFRTVMVTAPSSDLFVYAEK